MFSNTIIAAIIVILIYYALLTIWYSVLFIFAFPTVIERFKQAKLKRIIELINRDELIPITIITPIYNEAVHIINMAYAILNSDYKNIKFIIINDGSTDDTMALLAKEFSLEKISYKPLREIPTSPIKQYYQSSLFKNLMVIDKEHSPYGNGADSINAGLNCCNTPLMATVDADTILEPQALSKILVSFLLTKNCMVVGGTVYVLNENPVKQGVLLETKLPKKFIPAVQSVEYIRSFLYGRSGCNFLGGAMCFAGAFTLFETQAVVEVGGYDVKNYSYDAEMTINIHHWMLKHHEPHNLSHAPDSFGWTEVPDTLRSFWQQRNYWQRGTLRAIFKHFTMLFNPRYGVVGMISFPAFTLFEVLGPIVEFASYILLIICISLHLFFAEEFLWCVFMAWGYIALLSIGMMLLNQLTFNRHHHLGDTLRVMGLVMAELFGFRQYRIVCCFVATIQFFMNRLRGKPL